MTLFYSLFLAQVAWAELVPVDLNQICQAYTDCFNCTLAYCEWNTDTGQCDTTQATYDKSQLNFIFDQAQVCGDPLGICKRERFEDTINDFHLSFNKGFIPASYFC